MTSTGRARLVHLTTTDMSLDWLLRPQLEAFRDAGYEVIGCSAPGPHVATLEARGIRHVAVHNATRSIDPRKDLAALGELVRTFARLAPDIVHTHNPKPGVYGRFAARLAGVPGVVNTQHGLFATAQDRWAKQAVVYGVERLAACASDAELVQNPEDLELLARLGVPRRRLHLLGNGIDLTRFAPDAADGEARARLRAEWGVQPDEVVVGVVGRLVWEKGLAEVFAAARLLRTLDPKVRVVVVGPADTSRTGAVGDDDRAAASAAGAVVFAGERHDMEAVYRMFDLYVLASYREGWPRSAMEAAATGLAVITTDVRGCREVVRSGETGWLVPSRDAHALADAVASLSRDPDRRRAMGRAGRVLAEQRFDQRDVIARTIAVYDELARRRRSSSV